MNGRLRWYLPKGADIDRITQEKLDQLAAKMIVAFGPRMRNQVSLQHIVYI